MLKIILISFAVLFILFMLAFLYCALIVASRADDQAEEWIKKQNRQKLYNNEADPFR